MDWALTGASIGLIIAFCYLLDWLVSKKEEDKQKVTIIRWWDRLDNFSYGEAVRNANIFCNEIFNKIYGKKHFSLRCFGLSCCVSFLSVFILTIITIVRGYIDFVHWTEGVVLILTGITVLNAWVDYVSLIETRLILRYASRVKLLFLPVLLLLDVFLSAAIYLLAFVTILSTFEMLSYILTGSFPSLLALNHFFLKYIPGIITFDLIDPYESILFYSTFSTSIIFYLYCLSTVFFKSVKLSKTRIMVILEKLEDSDRLFKALGGFLAAVVGLVKCLVEICQYIAQK